MTSGRYFSERGSSNGSVKMAVALSGALRAFFLFGKVLKQNSWRVESAVLLFVCVPVGS